MAQQDKTSADSKTETKTTTAAAKAEDKPTSAPATKADAKALDDTKGHTKESYEKGDAAPGHYGRLAESDPTDSDYIKYVGYSEDESHVPDPFYQSGTLDTSDTAGGAHSNIREISPVFDVARARNLEAAQRALDPNDPTPAELVVLPDEVNTADAAKERLDAAVQDVHDNPVEIGGMTEEQRLAAEGDDADGKTEAKTDKDKTETK